MGTTDDLKWHAEDMAGIRGHRLPSEWKEKPGPIFSKECKTCGTWIAVDPNAQEGEQIHGPLLGDWCWIPKELSALEKSALRSCEMRGHRMRPFKQYNSRHAWSDCGVCGMRVDVKTRPAPNEIDICGEAVALNCGDERR